jgi:hypothetical protein
MENVLKTESKRCETKKTYLRDTTRITSFVIDLKIHTWGKQQTEKQDDLGSTAELYHRVQNNLAHFHF